MKECFLEVSQESGAAIFGRNITGEVIMLNLLRFRDIADYSANPELMPSEPVSGAVAYQKYIDHTYLRVSARCYQNLLVKIVRSGFDFCISALYRLVSCFITRIESVRDSTPLLWEGISAFGLRA